MYCRECKNNCCCKKESPKGLSFWKLLLYFLGLYSTQPPVVNSNESSSSSSDDSSSSDETEQEEQTEQTEQAEESSQSSEGQNNPEGVKMKRALCVGINNYQGTANDLKGCVNDAKNWANLLKDQYQFDEITTIFDNNATTTNVVNGLKKLRDLSKSGDVVVFTYSGHGSNVPDRYPIDEADGRDETLYLYDGHLRDDVLRDVFDTFDKSIKLVFIADCCHSGTTTRAMMSTLETCEEAPKPRYMPPEDDGEALAISRLPLNARIGVPQEEMNEVLVTGCKSTEYSYDASINGQPTGAMSYYAVKVLKENPKVTYNEFFAKLRHYLPSNRYPQTPQLEGSEENKNSIVFE